MLENCILTTSLWLRSYLCEHRRGYTGGLHTLMTSYIILLATLMITNLDQFCNASDANSGDTIYSILQCDYGLKNLMNWVMSNPLAFYNFHYVAVLPEGTWCWNQWILDHCFTNGVPQMLIEFYDLMRREDHQARAYCGHKLQIISHLTEAPPGPQFHYNSLYFFIAAKTWQGFPSLQKLLILSFLMSQVIVIMQICKSLKLPNSAWCPALINKASVWVCYKQEVYASWNDCQPYSSSELHNEEKHWCVLFKIRIRLVY